MISFDFIYSYIGCFFSSDLKQDNTTEKLITYLMCSDAFKKLYSDVCGNTSYQLEIVPLSHRSCQEQKIVQASLIYFKGFCWYFPDKLEIRYDASLDYRKIAGNIIIELCNAKRYNEYQKLSARVITENLPKHTYAILKEEIEWSAFNEAVKIADTFAEEFFDQKEHEAAKFLKKYMNMCEQSGHTERYRKEWEVLRERGRSLFL